MCPMCSDPVTFGGGITMENTGPGFPGSALNSSSFTQYSAQRGSICFGSYVLAISRGIPIRSPSLPAHHHKARPNPHKVILEYKVSRNPRQFNRRVAATFRWPTPTFECGGGASAFTHPATPPERAVSALTQADVLRIPHCLLTSDPQKNKKATQRVASSQKTLQSQTISSKPTRP